MREFFDDMRYYFNLAMGKIWAGLCFIGRVIRRVWRVVRRAAIAVAVIFGLFLVLMGGIGGYVWYKSRQDLASIHALKDPQAAPLPQPVTVYSRDGVKLGVSIIQDRLILSPKEIPAVMGQAAVSIEDQRFYHHPGVDIIGLARAAWDDLKSNAPSQGASTITMQYVNNVYLSHQKTLLRKLREAVLALQLEQVWTKQRILDAYLNTVYFGEGTYGIGAAAKYYFNEPASKLNDGQAALLAGMIRNPTFYDPHFNPLAAIGRRNLVLDEMFYQGYLTRAQVVKAKSLPLHLSPIPAANLPLEPLLFNYADQEAKNKLSPEQVANGGYKIITTFDMHLIQQARQIFQQQYVGVSPSPSLALRQVDPQTGAIVALAQTPYKQDFNLASQAERQPGSTVKAFTLATFLDQGGNLNSPIDDSPLTIKVSNGKYATLQPTYNVNNVLDAITYSQDPAFYRLYQQVGNGNVFSLEQRLGMQHMDAGNSAALGGTRYGASTLELAGAYANFATGGVYHTPYSVAKIVDNLGNVLYTHQTQGTQVVPNEVARRVNAALQNVVSNGFPQLVSNLASVRNQYPLAGKTGTTQDNADAWFVGYTPKYVTAVWTGYAAQRLPMSDLATGGVQGSGIPAQVFAAYSTQALSYLRIPPTPFSSPRNLVKVPNVVGGDFGTAATRMQQYGVNYNLVAVQSLSKSPNTVFKTVPAANAWISPSTTVQVSYAINERAMPDLLGQDYLTARRTLGGFTHVKEQLQVDTSHPLGTVVAQYPLPGISIPVDSTVKIAVAVGQGPTQTVVKNVPYVPSGSELANLKNQINSLNGQVGSLQQALQNVQGSPIIPNLVGLTTAVASGVIQPLGLTLHSSGGAGAIVTQTPAAGTVANPGLSIQVTAGP